LPPLQGQDHVQNASLPTMKKPIWHRPLGDDAWMLVKSVCSRRDSSRRTPRVHRDAVRTLRTVVDEVADEDPASWIDKRIVSCVGQSPDRPVRRPTSSGRVQRLPAKTPLSTVFRLTCSAYRDRRFFAITLSHAATRSCARNVTCGHARATCATRTRLPLHSQPFSERIIRKRGSRSVSPSFFGRRY